MSRIVMCSLVASIVAGVPDIFAASLVSRSPPGKVFQMVASGILGPASYQGGSTSTIIGIVLQIGMSFVMAFLYNLAAAQVSGIRQSPLTFGALYGVVIFVAMNFVVVPLSRAYPPLHWDFKKIVVMLVIMILFGEVISYTAKA